ncbi:EpsG family protein [bacterium]|nr:EpsG family protein [bacterium]MBU1958254.1 EpsG family protein [bacterium]
MKNRSYTLWIFAVLYAFVFVYLIPWTTLLGYEFVDIQNYLDRIIYLYAGGTESNYTGIQWILDEPLWKYIIVLIGYTFDDYRMALYLVSFIIVIGYSSFLFRRVEYTIGMILLLNPMSIDLFMAQIRSALAFSLLLIAYDLTSKRWATVVLILASFIHASMPLFIVIYFLLYHLNQQVESKKYYLIAIFSALAIALFIKFGLDPLLRFLGDRHAGYENVIEGGSIAYSIVWFMMAVVIATFATFDNEDERVLAGYAITMMSFFFFASLFGLFAQRYVALSMPLIIIAVGYLPKHFKQGTYVAFFAYNLLMFSYWL